MVTGIFFIDVILIDGMNKVIEPAVPVDEFVVEDSAGKKVPITPSSGLSATFSPFEGEKGL